MSFSIQLDSSPIDSFKAFNPVKNIKAYENLEKLQSANNNGEFYEADNEDKIFAKNWAPILCNVKGQAQIRPMRYGLVQSTDKDYENNKVLTVLKSELSTPKFSRSYEGLRGLISIKSFYIMDRSNGLIDILEYSKENSYNFLAPVIYDNWFSSDKSEIIQSFALITSINSDNKPFPLDLDFIQASSWIKGMNNIEHFKVAKLIKSNT